MGLESHVDSVIKRDAPELYGTYFWKNGMRVLHPECVESLLKVLNDSGEFGPAKLVGAKIRFGIHPMFRKKGGATGGKPRTGQS